MKKNLFTLVLIIISLTSFSQKGQRIAFVDMNYILENIPAYNQAQNQLNKKVQSWQQNLDNIKSEIETMKTDLSNQKVLLTDDLIIEKEEDIAIKEAEFKKVESQYFSVDGNLFLLRKQLVTPIQDQVYNAAQEIAKARRYDFVFDKSSDLIMLYSNKSNDISELVLRSIVRGEKATQANKKRVARGAAQNNSNPVTKTSTADQNQPGIVPTNNNGNPSTPNLEDTTTPSNEIGIVDSGSGSGSDELSSSKSVQENTPAQSVADPIRDNSISEQEAKRLASIEKMEQQKAARAKKREEQKAAIEKKRLERLQKRDSIRNELKEKKETTKEDNKENNN